MVSTFDTPLFTSDQSVDRVLSAGLPVLLVFSSGAAPAALEQAMKAAAKQYAGQLLVVQMNVKDSSQTTARFQVHNTPAVVAVKNGQVVSQAENISADMLPAHASYVLGKGPKPVAYGNGYQKAGAGASGSNAGAQSSSTNGGGSPVTVTDSTFEQEVMRSAIPVVVDFWAPWCGPCRMVAPSLDKLAREWNGRVKIAKVNVDENPNIASRYGITGIPTMFVVKSGQIVDRWAGALPEPSLRSRLASSIQ